MAKAAWRALALVAAVACCGCSPSTAALSPALERRFQTEGLARRADDIVFRYSHDLGTDRSGWEEWPASIVVTRSTIFIHDRDQVRLEVTPRSTGEYRVSRERDRLSLRAGSGRSGRSWAFHPPDDAAGWAKDMRAVIAASAGAKRRRSG